MLGRVKNLYCFVIVFFVACGGGGGGGGGSSSGGTSGSSSSEVLANVMIGSDGGTVTTSDSKVILTIPSGALSTNTEITVAKSTTGNPIGTIMDSYEFTSGSGSTFNAAVTISIKYDSSVIPADVNESDLKLAYESNGEWIIISESTVDTVNHILSGQTTHFTKYTGAVQEDCSIHGTLLGTFSDSVPVNVYSNGCIKYNYKYTKTVNCGSGTYDSATNTCINGTYIGLEWECVEFVNRYYLSVYEKDIASPRKNAKDYYNTASDRGLTSYENKISGLVAPQIGDLLVSEGDGTSGNVGHVAIIKEVATDYIIVAHQNWSNKSADRALNFRIKREGNYIHPFSTGNSYPIKGWLRLSNNSSDTTAPSIPSGLTASAASSSQINLSWTASPESDVAGYKVYKNGTYLKSVTITSASDTGLSASTQYCYTVSAYDTSNNESGQTNSVCATTSAVTDTTAPSSPSISIDSGASSTTSTSVTLTLSATDSIGVTGYYASEISTTPSASASGWITVTTTTSYSESVSFTLSSGSVGDNTKTVYVWFRDSAGNVSASASDSITLTVSDTTAPSSPSISINSGETSTTTISVTLTLSATDDVGVTGYCAKETSTTPLTNDTCWTSVTPASSYSANVSFTLSSGSGTKTVYVWFRDAAGNVSVSASDSITLSITSWTMLKLPDTGQTGNYTTTFGEDSDYTINPPSYTDNGNGTITDDVTGLIWQKEDDNTKRTWTDAGTYCDDLSLGRYTDWRLPSKKELISIVNYETYYPAINTTYFPNTNASEYWSSTMAAYDSSDAWYVDFDYGDVRKYFKSYKYYVRCVRGEGQTTTKTLTDNGNGTVTDSNTGLMWQKEYTSGEWESAITYCEGLSLGSYTDWRLPNIKELESITDDKKYNPAIDETYFPNTYGNYYFSSTTLDSDPFYVWNVYFKTGYILPSYVSKLSALYVRCVRGGQ